MYLPIRLTAVYVIIIFLKVPLAARAETYHWIDEQGIMHFSDNLTSQPPAKRTKVQVREDITISNPVVRESLKKLQTLVDEVARDDLEKARQRRQREVRDEQELKAHQAREKRLREEQVKLEQQEARELKRRLDTTPVQRSAEELGGFSQSGGST